MRYKLTFYSYWSVGSGKGAGNGKDNLVLKDKNGLPFVPGRTFKGLLRDAAAECMFEKERINELFGHENHNDFEHEAKLIENIRGVAFFSSVRLNDSTRHYLKEHKNLVKYLYQTRTSTRLSSTKQAVDHSLRKTEVCIPLELEGRISGPLTEDQKNLILKSLKMLKFLGEKRYRGLGRCEIKIEE